jgi:hypothetical protein
MTQLAGNYYGILVRFRERIEDYALHLVVNRRLGCHNWTIAAPTVIMLCAGSFRFEFRITSPQAKFQCQECELGERVWLIDHSSCGGAYRSRSNLAHLQNSQLMKYLPKWQGDEDMTCLDSLIQAIFQERERERL